MLRVSFIGSLANGETTNRYDGSDKVFNFDRLVLVCEHELWRWIREAHTLLRGGKTRSKVHTNIPSNEMTVSWLESFYK